MPPALPPERVTQNRVIARRTAAATACGLAYDYLGDRSKRDHNRCVAPDLLRANLLQRGYSEAHIAQAMHKLVGGDDATGITPYQANLCPYRPPQDSPAGAASSSFSSNAYPSRQQAK